MYYKVKKTKTSINNNQAYEGETIENKVNRIVRNKEPIKDGAPLIYADRKEGVMAGTDIRADRFDIAIDAMDKVTADRIAKREARVIEMNKKTEPEAPKTTELQSNPTPNNNQPS